VRRARNRRPGPLPLYLLSRGDVEPPRPTLRRWLVVATVCVLALALLLAARAAATAPELGTAARHTIARLGLQARVAVIIRRAFPDDQQRALCIGDHESDGTPNHFTPWALNGSNTGLFQLDRRTWDPTVNPAARPIVGDVDWSRMLEPAYNAMVARRVYLHDRARTGDGWIEWTTRVYCGA
jgi:hypothetical protein